MKIMLITAMEKEAIPLIKILNLKIANDAEQLPSWLQSTVYMGKINAHQIFLVVNGKDNLHQLDSLGAGVLPTATLALEILKPDLLINVGSAGGVSLKGMRIGDIVLCQDVVNFHDQLLEPDQIHVPYGIGSYPLINFCDLAFALQIKISRISTGSSLMLDAAHQAQFERNNAALRDMEAGHIARLCTQAKQRLLIIKVVSDLVDTSDCPQQQFTQNFGDVMQNLANKVHALIMILVNTKFIESS